MSHRNHILTSALREAFDALVDSQATNETFDIKENIPKGKNRKRAVNYYYKGKRSNPFAFIVNSGERKNYHLFYIRKPRSSDLEVAKQLIPASNINVNPREEITIEVRDRKDAEAVLDIVNLVKLS